MLFQLLDNVAGRIARLDPATETPRMAEQIRKAVPEVFDAMRKHGATDAVIQMIGLQLGKESVEIVRQIPGIVSTMRRSIESGQLPPALGCGMCATLAYLVQPNDLIPDNTPGGYGFIDDYVILRAGEFEYYSRLGGHAREVEDCRKAIGVAGSLVPVNLRPSMQLVVNGLSTTIQLLLLMPLQVQVMTMQMIIANPLQAAMPQAPPGFMPGSGFAVQSLGPQAVYEGRNTWRDGETIGVNFPGGGGVVSNGRDIFVT